MSVVVCRILASLDKPSIFFLSQSPALRSQSYHCCLKTTAFMNIYPILISSSIEYHYIGSKFQLNSNASAIKEIGTQIKSPRKYQSHHFVFRISICMKQSSCLPAIDNFRCRKLSKHPAKKSKQLPTHVCHRIE